ncbi:MAG TPA: hypothetical protein VMO26_05085 [Vicinamibacterales bacterium]|nr:hypothetical protein [Vicinamibacterales bacterium]
MRDALENPFDSLESTYEYICLLEEALAEAREVIEDDARAARSDGAARRLQALQIVSHKLHSLNEHMHASRRLLNDLRTLRRLLLGERELSLRAFSGQPSAFSAESRSPTDRR